MFIYPFRLDVKGHPNYVLASDHGREPMLRIPTQKVLPLYRALKKISAIYHHPDNVFVYKMQEGKWCFFFFFILFPYYFFFIQNRLKVVAIKYPWYFSSRWCLKRRIPRDPT